MIVLAFVIILSNFYRERVRETNDPQESLCDKNNLTQALRVTEYEPVNSNETDPENSFEINGTQYGCPCSRNRCIRKCCPWGHHLVDKSCSLFKNGLEQSEKEKFCKLQFYKTIKDNIPYNHVNRQFNIVFKLPDGCPENKMDRVIYSLSEFHLLENGNLWIKESYVDRFLYCFDYKGNDTETIHIFTCHSKIIDESNSEKDQSHWYIIKGYANVVSGVFFILTFLIYAVLPNLRNLNGKCLMSYFLSMLVSSLTLSTILLVDDMEFRKNFCAFLGTVSSLKFIHSNRHFSH